MYLTPHTSSAMAMFGFVYLWYLMAVLLLEIWLDYRRDIVELARATTGPLRHVYRAADARLRRRQPRSAPRRRARELRDHPDRDSLGVPAARLRRLHLRVGQGQPLVVDAADADRVPLLGHRLRHRRRDAALHGDHAAARARDRHALRRHDRALPVLRVHHRLRARDARPDPPHLRGGRVVPHARLHGADSPLPAAHRGPDRARHARADRAAWRSRSS